MMFLALLNAIVSTSYFKILVNLAG